MRIVFLGKNPLNGHFKGIDALKYLQTRNVEIVAIISACQNLNTYAFENNLPVKTIEEFNNSEIEDIDLVISYGYNSLIREPLLSIANIGCINFHPAPLPLWRGMGGIYNYAIYEGVKKWGVSCHYVDKTYDTGDIIKVIEFDIDTSNETAYSLSQISHIKLYDLFCTIINTVLKTGVLGGQKQVGESRYISAKDFNKLRKISYDDSSEDIDKKIKAFFYPPHHGAYIEIDGKEYSLINSEMLNEISSFINKQDEEN